MRLCGGLARVKKPGVMCGLYPLHSVHTFIPLRTERTRGTIHRTARSSYVS